MISVQNLELRAGARLLMEEVTFRIDKGDKIGLVGRNGAGKTTMTKVLAGLNYRRMAPLPVLVQSATCRRTPKWMI